MELPGCGGRHRGQVRCGVVAFGQPGVVKLGELRDAGGSHESCSAQFL